MHRHVVLHPEAAARETVLRIVGFIGAMLKRIDAELYELIDSERHTFVVVIGPGTDPDFLQVLGAEWIGDVVMMPPDCLAVLSEADPISARWAVREGGPLRVFYAQGESTLMINIGPDRIGPDGNALTEIWLEPGSTDTERNAVKS